jgi:hypothetical protein
LVTSSAIILCHVFEILRPRTSGQERCEPDWNSLYLLAETIGASIAKVAPARTRPKKNSLLRIQSSHAGVKIQTQSPLWIAPLSAPSANPKFRAKVLNSTEDAHTDGMSTFETDGRLQVCRSTTPGACEPPPVACGPVAGGGGVGDLSGPGGSVLAVSVVGSWCSLGHDPPKRQKIDRKKFIG